MPVPHENLKERPIFHQKQEQEAQQYISIKNCEDSCISIETLREVKSICIYHINNGTLFQVVIYSPNSQLLQPNRFPLLKLNPEKFVDTHSILNGRIMIEISKINSAEPLRSNNNIRENSPER